MVDENTTGEFQEQSEEKGLRYIHTYIDIRIHV